MRHDCSSEGQVVELWRYPVKSMAGGAHEELVVDAFGVVGDRANGVLDCTSGTILSAKREGRLLDARAALVANDLVVTLSDGREYDRGPALDEALGDWLGRAVRVVEAARFGSATFESPVDFERDDSELVSWEGVANSFVDESALHVLSAVDLIKLRDERPDLDWDVRRFRPNVVVDVALGDLTPGRRLHLGSVEVEITDGCSRCVMTTRPQPGGLERELDILRHVAREHEGVLGARARVVTPGRVLLGDTFSG
ncbi:MAG: MOSC N-terminal beta barrel domain-containing protein [Acidimicrobiales bacterium]